MESQNYYISSLPSQNSSLNNKSNYYKHLQLQFKLPGHSKVTEIIMNPQGPLYPESFKIESRRANDGYLFIGQNKFDKKSRQINDIVI